jgi:hypothetical protein
LLPRCTHHLWAGVEVPLLTAVVLMVVLMVVMLVAMVVMVV